MQNRNLVVIAIAVVFGLIAVVLANAYFSGVQERQETLAKQQALTSIVVATQPLQFGVKLTPQNIRMQNFPASSVPEGAFRSINDALKDNRVALRPIVPNEPILADKVSGTDGRATLAALLPDGMRAFSIPVDATKAVAGFVLPGTMVDVLLTRKILGDGATNEDMRADVILSNVQVLAIDQGADEKDGKPKVGKNATLAVSLFDAQKLTIAQRMGTLSLALRKVESASNTDPNGTAMAYVQTVTGRQVGGPRMYSPARREAAPRMAAAPVVMRGPVQRVNILVPGAGGTSMTVVRGTVPTEYPVGAQRGW